jgi:hypothetical protein
MYRDSEMTTNIGTFNDVIIPDLNEVFLGGISGNGLRIQNIRFNAVPNSSNIIEITADITNLITGKHQIGRAHVNKREIKGIARAGTGGRYYRAVSLRENRLLLMTLFGSSAPRKNVEFQDVDSASSENEEDLAAAEASDRTKDRYGDGPMRDSDLEPDPAPDVLPTPRRKIKEEQGAAGTSRDAAKKKKKKKHELARTMYDRMKDRYDESYVLERDGYDLMQTLRDGNEALKLHVKKAKDGSPIRFVADIIALAENGGFTTREKFEIAHDAGDIDPDDTEYANKLRAVSRKILKLYRERREEASSRNRKIPVASRKAVIKRIRKAKL